MSWFSKPYADFVQRLRVPFGFVLLIAFAWFSAPSRRSMLIGLPISVLGLWLRAWSTGHLEKDKQLATSGPYAYVRNPLYAGTLITALGIVIASRSLLLLVVFAVVFALVYLPSIELEEQHLREIFPPYLPYSERVHRFVPKGKWHDAESRRFSWLLYRKNKEYKAMIGFLIAVIWLAWKWWLTETVT